MDPLGPNQENVSENASMETNSENEIVQRTLDWFCFENDIKAVKKFEPEDIAENVNSLDQLNFDEIEIKREDGTEDDGKLELGRIPPQFCCIQMSPMCESKWKQF